MEICHLDAFVIWGFLSPPNMNLPASLFRCIKVSTFIIAASFLSAGLFPAARAFNPLAWLTSFVENQPPSNCPLATGLKGLSDLMAIYQASLMPKFHISVFYGKCLKLLIVVK
jgi:hypothetical protein